LQLEFLILVRDDKDILGSGQKKVSLEKNSIQLRIFFILGKKNWKILFDRIKKEIIIN